MMATPTEPTNGEVRPEEDPVTARYLWEPEAMAAGLSVHNRLALRWPFRVALHGFTLLYLVASIGVPLAKLAGARSDEERRGPAIALMIAVPLWVLIYTWARKKTFLRWQCRKAFRNTPGGSTFVEWSIDRDQLSNRTALTASTLLWGAFLRVVESPGGFLLYQLPGFFNYIPAHGFRTEGEMGRFRAMARSGARHYVVVGECRFAGKPDPTGLADL